MIKTFWTEEEVATILEGRNERMVANKVEWLKENLHTLQKTARKRLFFFFNKNILKIFTKIFAYLINVY